MADGVSQTSWTEAGWRCPLTSSWVAAGFTDLQTVRLVLQHVHSFQFAFLRPYQKNQNDEPAKWPIYNTFTLNMERQTEPRTGTSASAPLTKRGRSWRPRTSTASPLTDRITRGPRGCTRGRGSALVLPRQLTHHFQQSLVLLFELLVLVLDIVQVLREEQNRQRRGQRSAAEYSQPCLRTAEGPVSPESQPPLCRVLSSATLP